MTGSFFEQNQLETAKANTQAALERAVGEGRLTLDEFTERADLVWQANSAADLEVAVRDLPAPVVANAPTSGGRLSTSSIFDDVRRSGRFALRSGSKVSAVFGDVKLDLRQAVITEAVVELELFSCFGDIVVTVPQGVEVEVSSSRIFGDEVVDLVEAPRLPGSPTIRLRARAIFGDVKVRNQKWTDRLKLPWRK